MNMSKISCWASDDAQILISLNNRLCQLLVDESWRIREAEQPATLTSTSA